MARYGTKDKLLHKERVRELLLSNGNLSIQQIQKFLAEDKKVPLELDKDYVNKIVNSIKNDWILEIRTSSVPELLANLKNQFELAQKSMLPIILGQEIRQIVVTVPDPNNPQDQKKAKKRVETLRIKPIERANALRALQVATKEYVDKMLMAGNPEGIEGVDKSLLFSGTNINLTKIDIQQNVTADELRKQGEEINDRIATIRKRLARLEKRKGETPASQGTGEIREAEITETVSDSQSAIQGDASNDDGVHRGEGVSGSEGGHIPSSQENPV